MNPAYRETALLFNAMLLLIMSFNIEPVKLALEEAFQGLREQL